MADSIKTIGDGSGADFATIQLWATGWLNTGSSFAGGVDDEVGRLHGVSDEGGAGILIQSNKTSAAHYIVIESNLNRHEGKWDATKDHMVTTGFGPEFRDEYFQVRDTQFYINSTSSNRLVSWRTSGAANIKIMRNVLASNKQSVIDPLSSDSSLVLQIYNNEMWNTEIENNKTINSASYIAGNTIVQTVAGAAGPGLESNQNCTIKNNLVARLDGGTCYNVSGSPITGNNISTDATSPNPSFRDKNPVFANAAIGDLHLDITDVDATGTGLDLTALDADLVNDIDLDIASVPWNIGCDQPGGDTSPPAGGVLISPANGAIDILPNEPLVSSGWTDDTEPIFGWFQLDTVNTFDSPNLQESGWLQMTGGAVSWNPARLLETTYYWRIKPKDSVDPANEGPYTAAWSFTTTDWPYGILPRPVITIGSLVIEFTQPLFIHLEWEKVVRKENRSRSGAKECIGSTSDLFMRIIVKNVFDQTFLDDMETFIRLVVQGFWFDFQSGESNARIDGGWLYAPKEYQPTPDKGSRTLNLVFWRPGNV